MQKTIRIRFFKHDRAKYISHLDLMRCMTRVIRRAQIPAWYTEGFHPHLYLTFAQPLSLGFESDCELMELQLTAPMELAEIRIRLNAILPPEMQVEEVYEPQRKMDGVAFSVFSITLSPPAPSEAFAQSLEKLLEKPQWVVEKKTKRGVSTIDIRPYVELLESRCGPEEIFLRVKLPSGQEFSVNPNLFLSLLEKEAEETDCLARVRRVALYDREGKLFQ